MPEGLILAWFTARRRSRIEFEILRILKHRTRPSCDGRPDCILSPFWSSSCLLFSLLASHRDKIEVEFVAAAGGGTFLPQAEDSAAEVDGAVLAEEAVGDFLAGAEVLAVAARAAGGKISPCEKLLILHVGSFFQVSSLAVSPRVCPCSDKAWFRLRFGPLVDRF